MKGDHVEPARGRPIPPGAYVGRWLVLRRSTSVNRTWWAGMLSRVWCRCACGHEQAVLDRDLKLGRSTGCRSKACMHAWALAEGLVPAVGTERAREMVRAICEAEVSTYHVVRQAAVKLGVLR